MSYRLLTYGLLTTASAVHGEYLADVHHYLLLILTTLRQYMESILPTETAPYSQLHALLYRAHVYMITHGAVLCGETPQCAPWLGLGLGLG